MVMPTNLVLQRWFDCDEYHGTKFLKKKSPQNKSKLASPQPHHLNRFLRLPKDCADKSATEIGRIQSDHIYAWGFSMIYPP